MSHIYFKLTTFPATEESDSKEFELFYDKYKTAKGLGGYDDSFKVFLEDSTKNPSFGKIYSLTVGYAYEEEEIRITTYKGSEKNILITFFNLYNNEFFRGFQSVLFNAEFVLPFLSTRALKNGIKIGSMPKELQHFGLKSWNLKCVDLQAYYKGVGWFIPSLEEIALNLNLETDFVDGADVYNLIKSGQEQTVDQSSADELKTIINIHRILQDKEPITIVSSSVSLLSEEQEVKEEKLPLLERLFKSKTLTQEDKDELVKHLKKKRATKKDKEIIIELIKGALADIDQNFGKVKNEKEIETIISELKECLK